MAHPLYTPWRVLPAALWSGSWSTRWITTPSMWRWRRARWVYWSIQFTADQCLIVNGSYNLHIYWLLTYLLNWRLQLHSNASIDDEWSGPSQVLNIAKYYILHRSYVNILIVLKYISTLYCWSMFDNVWLFMDLTIYIDQMWIFKLFYSTFVIF